MVSRFSILRMGCHVSMTVSVLSVVTKDFVLSYKKSGEVL